MRVRYIPVSDLAASVSEPWVDPSRRPWVEGETACVPVKEGYEADGLLPKRAPYEGPGYQVLGDLVLLHGHEPAPAELDAIVAWTRPRGVLLLDGIDGAVRTPQVRVLWGSSGEVCHKEAGWQFWLDPAKVMFAQGNRSEKEHIGAVVKRGERVADLFAGIGYFTVPAATAGGFVHAMELNPAAYGFLCRNVVANGVADRVRTEIGDCRELLDGPYDRMIMGHFDAPAMLPSLIGHAQAGSTLHVHSIGPAGDVIRNVAERAGFGVRIAERRVKKYAPGKWHIVQDVILS